MNRENGKLKNKKYQTNPRARLKRYVIQNEFNALRRQRRFSDEPIQVGFEPAEPEISDPPDRASGRNIQPKPASRPQKPVL
jgi:hypothetical protein